jgi:Lrp/AsnC family leucine-responsive transcriptional regulator
MKSTNHEILMLDKMDATILSALQENALITHQQLGEEIHLSSSQISRRIQRLQTNGVISKSVTMLDASALGLNVRSFTFVSLARHGGDEGANFESAIANIQQVLACHSITGDADYLLEIVSPNLQELSESVFKKLTRLNGVRNIRSSIVLETIKSTTALPLDRISSNTMLVSA